MPIIPADDADLLVAASDLTDFEGAPFEDAIVKAAGEKIRDVAGWHIAPVRDETAYVDTCAGQKSLFLETRQLVEVVSVRDVTTGPDGPLVTGYYVHPTAEFVEGQVQHPYGWPGGVLKVDFRHGYAGCPASLATVVAEVCRDEETDGRIRAKTTGPFSEQYAEIELTADDVAVIDRYRLSDGMA